MAHPLGARGLELAMQMPTYGICKIKHPRAFREFFSTLASGLLEGCNVGDGEIKFLPVVY